MASGELRVWFGADVSAAVLGLRDATKCLRKLHWAFVKFARGAKKRAKPRHRKLWLNRERARRRQGE